MSYRDIIEDFFTTRIGEIHGKVYNEFSLQFELAWHIHQHFGDDGSRDVFFERNVMNIFNLPKKKEEESKGFSKKETDLSIATVSKDGCNPLETECSIELKYPTNGQVPVQMFLFIKDICFLEEQKKRGVSECYAVWLVDDPLFTDSASRRCSRKGIYAYFRAGESINGDFFGKKNKDGNIDKVTVDGTYTVKWKDAIDGRKYCILKI